MPPQSLDTHAPGVKPSMGSVEKKKKPYFTEIKINLITLLNITLNPDIHVSCDRIQAQRCDL